MNSGNYISNYISIRENKVAINGQVVFNGTISDAFPEFIRKVYRHYEMNYLPFFKMDDMCKLGFCAAELLLKNEIIENYSPETTGIVLSNKSSSMDTDLSYFDTIKDRGNYFPSPAVFVYTLPNIVIGEICIRHKIKGESAFFVTKDFDPDFITAYVNILLNGQKLSVCLAGWLEYFQGKYNAFLYFVHQGKHVDNNNEPKVQLHTSEVLKNLYNGL